MNFKKSKKNYNKGEETICGLTKKSFKWDYQGKKGTSEVIRGSIELDDGDLLAIELTKPARGKTNSKNVPIEYWCKVTTLHKQH